jgi:hypothetical protein
VKKSIRCLTAIVVAVLAACGSSDQGSTPAPTNVRAIGGDGYMLVSWDTVSGIDYFAFAANDPSLTSLNWLNLPGASAYVYVQSPMAMCGLVNGQEKWVTVNGRSGNSAGGPGSPAISATPRPAGDFWLSGTPMIDTLNGIGFSIFTTCLPSGLPTGFFTAVGPNAALYTSPDGVNWSRISLPLDFTADLYAVANYTANINLTSNLGIRTIAVGAGGASLYSTDNGVTWNVGRSYNAGLPTFRGITTSGSLFLAVGDSGAIETTSDGITWSSVLAANSTVNLNGVVYANGRYVAVGDGGTLLISTDNGFTWVPQTLFGVGTLRAIAYGNNDNNLSSGGIRQINTFVAVGDNGAAVVSNDGGLTWNVVSVPGATDLRGVTYTTRFTAVDSSGNSFSSETGQTWTALVETGQPGLNALATNGFRLVAVGAAGANASSL